MTASASATSCSQRSGRRREPRGMCVSAMIAITKADSDGEQGETEQTRQGRGRLQRVRAQARFREDERAGAEEGRESRAETGERQTEGAPLRRPGTLGPPP